MTCQDFIDLVIDYCEGQVGSAARVRVVEHRHRCVDCDRYLAVYRALIRVERWAYSDEQAVTVPEDLVAAILNARRRTLRESSFTDPDGFASDSSS
jgi:hypothetical protein